MPPDHQFEHLPLVLKHHGPARLTGGGSDADLTKEFRRNRKSHSTTLLSSLTAASDAWRKTQVARREQDAPEVEAGIPLVLQVDTSLDLDDLRRQFAFEVVAEEEDGYVIVASEDVDLALFRQKVKDFAGGGTGSGNIAKVHELLDSDTQEDRLRRVLSERLFAEWPEMQDDALYICDVGIACTGNWAAPNPFKPRAHWKAETNQRHEEKNRAEVQAAYDRWDELREDRRAEVKRITDHYGAEVLGEYEKAVPVPDSFTLRVRIAARGLKDLVLSYPYVFEVTEPDEIETPQQQARDLEDQLAEIEFQAPAPDAPVVCVIDSGIQEEHRWLAAAVDGSVSKSFLPAPDADSVADHVAGGGHGTRVAGAVLYGRTIPKSGVVPLEARLQNARVLNGRCEMPREMFPPEVLEQVVEHFHRVGNTRLFNQSVNADSPCRTTHMSAWAAEIDRLSHENDILVVQSTGNLKTDRPAPRPGVAQLLETGRPYPDYLDQPACRLANPAQSLQAMTVGSVAIETLEQDGWRSIATASGAPSAFGRSGPGIWGVIKPEVVEQGGDFLVSDGAPPAVATPDVGANCYTELVRSTRNGGPAHARDCVGTSFAAPQVARIAARLQAVLPEEPCLLYRALIAQSARWPAWANGLSPAEQAALLRRIGYGIPDLDRATTNTDQRVTLITSGKTKLEAGGCHIYQVPVPERLRRPGEDHQIRIDVTLSYSTATRRTRRKHAYQATWLDWVTNRRDELLEPFVERAIKREAEYANQGRETFNWTVHPQVQYGLSGANRSAGTLQKDWAYINSYNLPRDFCIAVRGHQGWNTSPDSSAAYTLAVTFEATGGELSVYEEVRAEVLELIVQAEQEVEISD